MGVLLVLAGVLAVVVAAKAVPELVRDHQIREAVGVDQGEGPVAFPWEGVGQDVPVMGEESGRIGSKVIATACS